MNYREAWANGEIEAGTLVDRIEEQGREIERLKMHLVKMERRRARREALKAQPSGVVLPEYKAEPNPTWAAAPHVGRPLNAEEITEARAHNSALDEVARLNSSPASAGDERAAFESAVSNEYPVAEFDRIGESAYRVAWVREMWAGWQLRATLSANHSEQVRHMVPDEMRSLAQRLREYNLNPHHINPMSDAFHELVVEAADALSASCAPKEIISAITWADHLIKECFTFASTRAPSVHVYNKTFEAVNAAKSMLAAAPSAGSQGGDV